MKRVIFTLFLFAIALGAKSQGYNEERVALTNFLVRMYHDAPFEGVRAVNDYDNAYLICALALDKSKYKNEYEMNRVASVKAASKSSAYINGQRLFTEEMVIRTDRADGQSDEQFIEKITSRSVGYVKALEQLTNFPSEDGMQVFIFISPMEEK